MDVTQKTEDDAGYGTDYRESREEPVIGFGFTQEEGCQHDSSKYSCVDQFRTLQKKKEKESERPASGRISFASFVISRNSEAEYQRPGRY
jgi:hypothetical protein